MTDGEGRAGDRSGDTKSLSGAAYERRLARPQLAGNGYDVTRPKPCGQSRGQRLRLLRRGGDQLEPVQNRPSWTAGSAATNGAGSGSGLTSCELSIRLGKRAKSSSSTLSMAGVYSAAAGW